MNTNLSPLHSPHPVLSTDLIDVRQLIPDIHLDLRYATANNFTGQRIYSSANAFLRQATAHKLDQAHRFLKAHHFSLKIWDAYRPLSAQKIFWSLMPDERYVASPETGSMHNRGNAVDVTLIDLSSGQEVDMPTGFDDFSPRAHHSYREVSAPARAHRSMLRHAMELAGFEALETEWWHYHDPEGMGEILDIPI